MSKKYTIITESAEQTKNLGISLGKICKGGEVFALTGELGAGKTVFTKGLSAGLDVTSNVVSPTFMLVRIYHGQTLTLNHFDFYRLESYDDLYSIGFEDYIDGQAVTVIEWAEKFEDELPESFVKIVMSVLDEEKRTIEIHVHGKMEHIENFLQKEMVKN